MNHIIMLHILTPTLLTYVTSIDKNLSIWNVEAAHLLWILTQKG